MTFVFLSNTKPLRWVSCWFFPMALFFLFRRGPLRWARTGGCPLRQEWNDPHRRGGSPVPFMGMTRPAAAGRAKKKRTADPYVGTDSPSALCYCSLLPRGRGKPLPYGRGAGGKRGVRRPPPTAENETFHIVGAALAVARRRSASPRLRAASSDNTAGRWGWGSRGGSPPACARRGPAAPTRA